MAGTYTWKFPLREIEEGERVPVMARLLEDDGSPAEGIPVQFYLDYNPCPDEDDSGTKVPQGVPQYTKKDGIARMVMEIPLGIHDISVCVIGSPHIEAFSSDSIIVKEKKGKSLNEKRTEELKDELKMHEAQRDLDAFLKPGPAKVENIYFIANGPRGGQTLQIFVEDSEEKPIVGAKGTVNYEGRNKPFEVTVAGHAEHKITGKIADKRFTVTVTAGGKSFSETLPNKS